MIKKIIYNEIGLAIKEIDAAGYESGTTDQERYGTIYEYDKAGRMEQKRVPKTIGNGEVKYALFQYVYDNGGNLIEGEKEYV